MTPILQLRNVHKVFGAKQVLSGFELDVSPSEVIGLLGPSGIGKSTLLRMVAGLEKPTSGEVMLNATRIGYVFQEPRLLPWSTALDNVALPLQALGMPRTRARQVARQSLERMHLAGVEKSLPHTLSGGMKQRVSMARALAVDPDLLLLDEPFNGLDRELKQNIRALLDSVLENSKAAVIHVTHNPEELLERTGRVINIRRPSQP